MKRPFKVRPSVPSRSTEPGPPVAMHLEVLGARTLARRMALILTLAADELTTMLDADPIVARIYGAAAGWNGVDVGSMRTLNLIAIVQAAAESDAPADELVSFAIMEGMKSGFDVQGVSVSLWIDAINAWRSGETSGRARRGRPKKKSTARYVALGRLFGALTRTQVVSAESLAKAFLDCGPGP